jgi:peptidoglycan-associated lipoprotein
MKMMQLFAFPGSRKFLLAGICVTLAACSTMQKSSTGSDRQGAAPISEAGTPEPTAKPAEIPGTAASPAAATPAKPDSNSAKSADTTGTTSGAKQGASESTAASSIDEEAALLKRRLAEQDAQISKLRNDQQDGAGREAAGAATQAEQQSAAAATEQPVPPGVASTTASKQQDEMAVFPANGNAAMASAEDSTGRDSAAPQTSERSVYFEYNESFVPEKYDSMLMANAAYLKAHPNFKVEVQGNCDERGSREYNLALGARRAESVKRALELAGVDGSRISVVSYGSEKPVATGKDEESYSQNRRADIVY